MQFWRLARLLINVFQTQIRWNSQKRISGTTTIEEQRAKLRERLAKENEKKTPFES